MAFPADWAGYASPNSLLPPSSSLSNFTYLISLSEMPASWWSNVKSDGGDIRVTKSDGSTQLPFDLIEWDYASQTGILAIQYTGTQTTSPDDFYIWAGDASATLPAAGDTYGQYNTYESGIKCFYPNGGGNDRTVNALNLTMTGATTGDSDGPINGSKATNYNGTNQKASRSSGAQSGDCLFLAHFYDTKGAGTSVIFARSSAAGNIGAGIFLISSTSEQIAVYRDGAGSPVSTSTGTSTPLNNWGAGGSGFDATAGQIFTRSYLGANNAVSSSDGDGGTTGIFIAAGGSTNYWGGRVANALYKTDLTNKDDFMDYWFSMIDASDPDQSNFYGGWTWTANSGPSSFNPAWAKNSNQVLNYA
ncbi:MAG: hypothetical protein IPM51_11885 [Sphingobacteriaceae bacterium]|nr:hypothetical protein [Sphingobacteriaceae bacterium]